MITKIGLVAGEIWDYLEKSDRSSQMDDIIGNMDNEKDLILMSIGWLAREGHIVLEGNDPNYVVKLTSVRGG